MPQDFGPEVLRLLKQAGCVLVRNGHHPIWHSPLTDRNFPVPHRIKSRFTANGILKQAGLPKAF